MREETIQSPDFFEDILSFYKAELPKRGWQFEGESGSYLGYLYPNHDGSAKYSLLLRVSVGMTEDLKETLVGFDQIVVQKGVHFGITP